MPSTAATPITSDAIAMTGGLSVIVGELASAIALASSEGGKSALTSCAATTMTALKSAIPTIALTIAVQRTDEARHRPMTATTIARQPATREIVGDWMYASRRRLSPYAIDLGNGPETEPKAMNVTTLAAARTSASNPGQFRGARTEVVSFIRHPVSGWPKSSLAHRSRIQHQHADPCHPEEGQGAA